MGRLMVRTVSGVVAAAALACVLVPELRAPVAARLSDLAGPAKANLPDKRRPTLPAVTVTHVREHDFVDRLFVSGTLVARDEAMVGPQIDGLRIVELLAEDGDRVAKGQVLARLDRSQLEALLAQNDASLVRADAAISQAHNQIANTEAMWTQAAADLGRAQKLEPGIITQASLDQRIAAARSTKAQAEGARSALAVAEAEKRSREAERRELMVRIDHTDVRAPVAGIVSRRTARLGALAMSMGDPLFRIISDGAIDLEAEVPEEALAKLALGMPARLSLPGLEGSLEGKVRLISSEVDKATRLGKVRVALPDGAPAHIGAFASGVLEVVHRTSLAVPAAAIIRAGAERVAVVKDGRVALRTVTAGITDSEVTEMRQGIEPGEAVVVRAAAFLRDGDEVRAVDADAPREAAR
jgi:RND family efflux transporter MFP subunit